jgi:hypothetical protein
VNTLLNDIKDKEIISKNGVEGLKIELNENNVKYLSFDQYKKIENIEFEKGKELKKIREKIIDLNEMIDICFDK